MAAKKTEAKDDATSKVVDVTVPAVKGVALNDIYKAALTSVRDDIPLRSDLVYSLEGSEKKGDERTYQVKIAWGEHTADPRDSDPADGDFVGQQLDSLSVPKTLPVGAGGDDDK